MENTNQAQPTRQAVSYAATVRRSQDTPVATSSSAKPEQTPVPKPGQANADTTKPQTFQPAPIPSSLSPRTTLTETSTSNPPGESVTQPLVSRTRASSSPSTGNLRPISEPVPSPTPNPLPKSPTQDPTTQIPGPESSSCPPQTRAPANRKPKETKRKVSYAEALRGKKTMASSPGGPCQYGSKPKGTGTGTPSSTGADSVTSAASKQSSGPPPKEVKNDVPGPDSQMNEQPSQQPTVAVSDNDIQGESKSKRKNRNKKKSKNKNSAADPPVEGETITSPPPAPVASQAGPSSEAPAAYQAATVPQAPAASQVPKASQVPTASQATPTPQATTETQAVPEPQAAPTPRATPAPQAAPAPVPGNRDSARPKNNSSSTPQATQAPPGPQASPTPVPATVPATVPGNRDSARSKKNSPSTSQAAPAPQAPPEPQAATSSVPGNRDSAGSKKSSSSKKGKGVANAEQSTTTPSSVGQALRQNAPLADVDLSEVDAFVENKISEALAKEEVRKWHFEQKAIRTQAMIAAHDRGDINLWHIPHEWDVLIIWTHPTDPTKSMSFRVHHDILSRESEFFKTNLPPKDSYGGYVHYDCSQHDVMMLSCAFNFMYMKQYEGGALDLSNGVDPLDGEPIRKNVIMFLAGLSVECRSLMNYAVTKIDEISDTILSKALLTGAFCQTHDIFRFTRPLTLAILLMYERPPHPNLYHLRLAMTRLLDVILVPLCWNAAFRRTMDSDWMHIITNVVDDSIHFFERNLLFDDEYRGEGLERIEEPTPPSNQGSAERRLSGSSTETETPRPRGNCEGSRSQGSGTAGHEGVDVRGDHQVSDARGGGQGSEQPSGKSSGKGIEQANGNDSGQASGQASAQSSGQTSGQIGRQASTQSNGQAGEQSSGQASGQASGKGSEKFSGQASASGQASEQVGGQVSGKIKMESRDASGNSGCIGNNNLGGGRGGTTSHPGRRTMDGSEDLTIPTPTRPLTFAVPNTPSRFHSYTIHPTQQTYQTQQIEEPFRSQQAHLAHQAQLAQQAQYIQQVQQIQQSQYSQQVQQIEEPFRSQQAHLAYQAQLVQQAQQAYLNHQPRQFSAATTMNPAIKRRKLSHHPPTYSGVYPPSPSTAGLSSPSSGFASPPSTVLWQSPSSATSNTPMPRGPNPGTRLVPAGMAFPPGPVFPGPPGPMPSPALPPAAYLSPPPPPMPQGRHRTLTVVHRPAAVRFADPVAVVVGEGSTGPDNSGSGGSGGRGGGSGGGGGRGGYSPGGSPRH